MKKKLLRGFYLILIGIVFIWMLKRVISLHILKIQDNKNQIERRERIIKVYRQWFSLKLKKKSIVDYLVENGYRSIVIYGMGHVGKNLCEELIKENNLEVKYAIDQNAGYKYKGVIVYSLDELFSTEKVDLIIVTVANGFDKIQENLNEITSVPVIDFYEIIDCLHEE